MNNLPVTGTMCIFKNLPKAAGIQGSLITIQTK